MYLISITFDENKVPRNYRDIHNNKCISYMIGHDFLNAIDERGIKHFYRKDLIVAFHIEEVGNEE